MAFQWTEELQYLFHEGRYFQAYEAFGAHPVKDGVRFCIWVPDVQAVAVVGDFNQWDLEKGWMQAIDQQNQIWEGFFPYAKAGDKYKYVIVTNEGRRVWKMDPYGRQAEAPPHTASIVSNYELMPSSKTSKLVKENRSGNRTQPMNIYEVHIGSWREGSATYAEMSKVLPAYLVENGYTHVELMPIMYHPFGGSWGYQITNFFSPAANWGTPEDLKNFVDACHQSGIGVIFDWVPGHFCQNEEGLISMNGHDLYESEEHPEWGTRRFNLRRPEVICFLISNAAFWFAYYDIDGIRVDGIASMLQPEKEYDTDAIHFFRTLNQMIFRRFPYAIVAAEDSTAFPKVTEPVYSGGLGFNYKWNMGWMNDTLRFFSRTPLEKRKHHHELTFSLVYAFHESFILPFSHDEVVHGKLTLLDRMKGEYNEKFAQLRVLYMYMMTHPGKKLNFMGNELAPFLEWRYYEGLEWKMLQYDQHRSYYRYVKAMNHFYLKEKALWELDHSWKGFRWIDADNASQSVFIYQRIAKKEDSYMLVLLNTGPYDHKDFRIGVPQNTSYRLTFASKDGTAGLKKTMKASPVPFHQQPYSIRVNLPAYTGIILKPIRKRRKKDDTNIRGIPTFTEKKGKKTDRRKN